MNPDRPDPMPGVKFMRGCLWALALEAGLLAALVGLWVVTR